MNRNRQWRVLIPVAVAAVAIAAYLTYGTAPAAISPAATMTTVAAAPHEIIFAPGAPQLDMLRVQALPALAVPLSAALPARVVVDEDVTARLGAGVAGRVVAIKAAPGDRVRAGQVLAEIDAPEFGAALADVDRARSDEDHKWRVVERARTLVAGEGIAGRDIEAAEADLAQAHAETVRARQRLANLAPALTPAPKSPATTAHGQRLALASPINGVVVERAVNPALEVGPGMAAPLFVVTDPNRLWLMLDVPEALLAQVRLGVRVDVESDAFPGEHFNAIVTQRGQTVDPDTRRVAVRARLDNPQGKLLPEMFVRGALLQDKAQALSVRVPNSALVNRGLYTYVFVERAPGRFERRQVTLLTTGADNSYIGAGVVADERIVTTGALLLDAEMSARAADLPGNAP
jgi:membrane fusion protein, heavy metal efflux system